MCIQIYLNAWIIIQCNRNTGLPYRRSLENIDRIETCSEYRIWINSANRNDFSYFNSLLRLFSLLLKKRQAFSGGAFLMPWKRTDRNCRLRRYAVRPTNCNLHTQRASSTYLDRDQRATTLISVWFALEHEANPHCGCTAIQTIERIIND